MKPPEILAEQISTDYTLVTDQEPMLSAVQNMEQEDYLCGLTYTEYKDIVRPY